MCTRTISTIARHRPAFQAIEVTRTTINSPANIAFTILPPHVLRHVGENHFAANFVISVCIKHAINLFVLVLLSKVSVRDIDKSSTDTSFRGHRWLVER